MSRIILGSGSPRRKEMLESLHLKFDIVSSNSEEKIDEHLSNEENVEKIALGKALDVAERTKDTPSIIITADTMVVSGRTLIGKPTSDEDAFWILRSLSGKEHEVITGVCIFNTEENRKIVNHRNTKIKFATLSDEVIWRYIKTGEGRDKAGAYAIQGLGSLFVDTIEGCYTNVVGLPITLLCDMLAKFDVQIL